MSASEPSRRATLAVCLLAIVAGAVVRLLPCFNDFWLDEIWTYFSVRRLSSPLEVFTAIHSSNNNHLNSLLFYALGDRESWAVYRIPSFLAGVGAIAVSAAIAGRRGRLEAVFAALLSASCFALVHFSSEARGYSIAVFCALSAYWALERHLERGDRGSAVLFGALVVLGILSHLVTLFFYAGALVHSAQRLLRARARRPAALRRLAWLHLLPVACFAALYLVDLRQMTVGGGNPADLQEVLTRSFGFALGLPVVRALALPYALLGIAILGFGLRLLWKRGDDAWGLFLITIAVAPALAIGGLRPEVVAVRYFLIGTAFTLLLLSDILAHAYRSGALGRAASLAALALFLIGNAHHTLAFLERGRGGYREALHFMARHTDGPRVSVGSDHDFRNGIVLRFYARTLPEGKTLFYTPRGRRPPGGPEWLVRHRAQRPSEPAREITDSSGNRYRLAAEFDHAAISGFYWAVYRNASLPPADRSDP